MAELTSCETIRPTKSKIFSIGLFTKKKKKCCYPLSYTEQEKKRKKQVARIRNEKLYIATDPTEIKMIIRKYYEQLYGNNSTI